MKSSLLQTSLRDKTVLLRFDGNVPLDHHRILNDQRLLAVLPTLQVLLEKGATVILLTHIGRPEQRDRSLSTIHLIPWFEERGIQIAFAQTPAEVLMREHEGAKVILMDNLRFFPGEKTGDKSFAQELAQLGDYYVNDAFGTMGRHDTSITLLPNFFDEEHKTIGLLVEHELTMLNRIKSKLSKPSLLILGGNKMSDKIPLLYNAIPKLDTVLLAPAVVFSFLKAAGKPIGGSLVDNNTIGVCKDLIMYAEESGVSLVYPLDYVIAEQNIQGSLDITEDSAIPHDAIGMSIGPKTANLWTALIMQAKSVVMNGFMGSLSRPESLIYTRQIYHAMATTQALTVVAGGDSVAAAHYFDVSQDIDYFSTGGSAAIAYLYDIPLEGITALKNRTKP